MLVRLCKFQSYPQSLREPLADYDVVKTGVVILDDENKLMVDYNLDNMNIINNETQLIICQMIDNSFSYLWVIKIFKYR